MKSSIPFQEVEVEVVESDTYIVLEATDIEDVVEEVDVGWADMLSNEGAPAPSSLAPAMVASEEVPLSAAHTKSGIERTMESEPCYDICGDSAVMAPLLRECGNSIVATRQAIKKALQRSLATSCKGCSERYLGLVDALEHHVSLLVARATGNDSAALVAARSRGAVLKKLGYKAA